MKKVFLAVLLSAFVVSCIQMDAFLFDGDPAESVEGDYHGLPLWNGEGAPEWITEAEVEREIYIRVPSGEVIPPDSLAGEKDYIHGMFLHAPTDCPVDQCPLIEDPPTILYQHGRSGNIWLYWYRAVALWNMGANVFIYTYRGYGLSSGEATTSGVLEDAETAADYITGRSEVNLSNIVVYGYSLGGIPTSYLVGRSEHKGVFRSCIMEATLDSPVSLVNMATGTDMPDGFFLDADSEFDGPVFMEGADLPILHVHGQNDTTVMNVLSENYYDVLKDRSDYTHYLGKTDKPDEEWIRGCNHRNIPFWSWGGSEHIPDYWGHSQNPNHCCVHPLEYTEAVNSSFIEDVGNTSSDELLDSSLDYKNLISGWLLEN